MKSACIGEIEFMRRVRLGFLVVVAVQVGDRICFGGYVQRMDRKSVRCLFKAERVETLNQFKNNLGPVLVDTVNVPSGEYVGS